MRQNTLLPEIFGLKLTVFIHKYIYFAIFHIHCPLVSNAKENIAKSNRSELWNRLSYRGLPYLFKVRSQTFRNNCKILRPQFQNSILIAIQLQRPHKA